MIELIPAIDIIDGKCVRLSQGDYSTQKVYNENPVEVAKEFEAHGIHRLHIVDLDGAASRHVVNYRVLDQIASRTSLVIDFGGGIKTDEDLVIAFDNGAQMVTLGSVAVKNPGLFKKWLEQYGNEKIILGADVKKNKISVNGWKEESQQQLIPFLKDYTKEGVFKVLCTDISRNVARTFRGTIPANPEGVPEYASDSQRRSKLYTGHYRPGNSQSSGCCFRQGIIRGKNYIERLKPFHVKANHVSKKNHTLPGHQRRADRKRNQFRKLTSSR